MTRQMKLAIAATFTLALAGCGLRGDLERPPPIFSQPPSEEAKKPLDTLVAYQVAEMDPTRTYLNSFGGEIPKPSPGEDVLEESMGEFEPG
ncbi:MAG: lipoprotein [Pseudomonadota bacterium]